jgi:hypothetical protein
MNLRKLLATVMAAFLVLGASALPAQAAKAPKTYNFKVTGTISGASGKTVLLLADTGRVLGSQSIVKSKQALSITSSQKTSNLSGATLQLVTTSGGDYYGPVVLGWKSKSSVYTQFGTKASSKGKYKVGTIVVSSASASGLQGYGKVKKKLSVVKKNVVAATNYKPAGVGNYGKTGGAAVSLLGNARGFIGSGPIGDIDLRNTIPQEQAFDGGDADGDGLPNAFDVNDDGDALLDQADSNSPTPSAGANCQAGASFNVFTNFKSTQTDFFENINYYGQTGTPFKANTETIAAALERSLSVVLSPITQVCNSNVVKTEFKGIGVPYAPSEYVDISDVNIGPGTTRDYQWKPGDGKVGGVLKTTPFDFTSANQISGQDVLMQRVTTADGNQYEFASSVGFVFVTHPVPVAWALTTDNADATSYTDITFNLNGRATYSITGLSNGASNNTLVLKVTRPQRLAIDGESGSFYDLAGFRYTPDMPNDGAGKCDALSYSDTQLSTDSAVTETPSYLVIKWRLKDCYSSRGTWQTGSASDFDVQVEPSGSGGNSAQKLSVTKTN